MRKILYIPMVLCVLAIFLSSFAEGAARSNDKMIRHSFHHAKNIHRFDKENGFVEYDFMMKGQYVSAFYDASGNLVETYYSISLKGLPAKTREFIQTEFSNPAITDIFRVENRQSTCYKIRLESNGKEYMIAANSEGDSIMGF